jgi:hypothetical protein
VSGRPFTIRVAIPAGAINTRDEVERVVFQGVAITRGFQARIGAQDLSSRGYNSSGCVRHRS